MPPRSTRRALPGKRTARLACALTSCLVVALSAAAPAWSLVRSAATHPRSSGSSISAAAIVLLVLAALLLIATAAWAIARRRAFEPRWMLSLRHSLAEGGFRASATWAEFSDWARLGR